MYKYPVQNVATSRDTWRDILREQGRSLAWLADHTAVARNTVYSYSMGRRTPTAAWLERAAIALGVPKDLLA